TPPRPQPGPTRRTHRSAPGTSAWRRRRRTARASSWSDAALAARLPGRAARARTTSSTLARVSLAPGTLYPFTRRGLIGGQSALLLDVFQLDAPSRTDACPSLLNPLQKPWIVFQPVVEPVIL